MRWAEITVRVTPRARTEEVVGERDGTLLVRVRAPPVDDRANAAVCRVIAERAGVRPRSVSIVRGGRSREKLVRVEGLSAEELMRSMRG